MYFWYQQGNKTLLGLYFQWGCWDTNQSDLVQALKHSVQVRKKLKCTILLHSCKMFRHLVEGIRCWRWTETAATKVVVNSPIFVDWNRKWTAVETQLPIGRTNVGIVHFVQITGYHSVFFCSSPSQRAENIPRCPQNDPLCDLICSWPRRS